MADRRLIIRLDIVIQARLVSLLKDLHALQTSIRSFDNGRCEGEFFADEIQEVLDRDSKLKETLSEEHGIRTAD